MEVSITQLTLKRVGTALAVLLVSDALWFSYSSKHIYPKFKKVTIAWGLIAWIALAKGVSAGKPQSQKEALLWGAAVGAICYAVFNGTELAIRHDWTVKMAFSDLLWGTFVCSFTSWVVFKLLH